MKSTAQGKRSEAAIRREVVQVCRDLYLREMVSASGGNVSVRAGGFVLITPGGKSLGRLNPRQLVKADERGRWRGSNRPSKELGMHLAIYTSRSNVTAVVHTHSPYAVALSCLQNRRTKVVLPVLTPGYAIRVGSLPLVPYLRPGSAELMREVRKGIGSRDALLLQNHGIIAVGATLEEAANRAEEVEETAKIFLLTGGKARSLTPRQTRELERAFKGGGARK